VDDIALLIKMMGQMGLVEIIDRHIKSHGNSRRLSWGWTVVIWLAFCVSTGNHQKLPVRKWVAKRLHILSALSGQEIDELDFSDDRLANVLTYLSATDTWRQIEQELSERTINVYQLEKKIVRIDTTTISGHHNKGNLFNFGHSKGNPDLRQIKLMLGSLDPLGMPIVCDVVSGEKADDPLYIPCIDRMMATLKDSGLLFVGDCKMGAFDTRFHLESHAQFYLCPLANVGQTAVDFPEWIQVGMTKERANELTEVYRYDDKCEAHLIARGYEFERQQKGEHDGKVVQWTERVLLVRSLAYAATEQKSLEKRLERASEDLVALTPQPTRGKKQIRDEETMQEKIEGVLKKHRVDGLLTCEYNREEKKRIKYVGKGRGSSDRPQIEEITVRYQVTSVVKSTDAIEREKNAAGWRVYVTNAVSKNLSLEQAALTYRQQYRIEQIFHRLKSTLNIEALYVKRDDQVTGMTHFITLGVRVLSLTEFVVRRSLNKTKTELVGLHPENPKKKTSKPTAERILKAFREITLNLYENGVAILTPLTEVQKNILKHLGLNESVYLNLEKAAPD
jgi:transposase